MSWPDAVLWAVIACAVSGMVWAAAWARVRMEQVDGTRPVHVRCDCGDEGDDDGDPAELDRYGVDRDWAPAQRDDE